MFTYQVKRTICPQCGKRIRLGVRRFGPAQVRCGHCGAIMYSSLDEWATLPAMRKVWLALLEFLNPSWMGVSDLGVVALRQFALWAVFFLPVAMVIPVSAPDMLLETAMSVSMLAYPSLLMIRLVLMVRESNTFTQTNNPPTWK